MDYTQNPFFGNPYIESIGNNLIKAFNDDGRGAENQARRRLLDAQTEDQVGKNRGREAAATAVQGFDPKSPIAGQFLQNLYSNYVRSGMDPGRASAIVLGMTANGGAPDATVARAFVGDGHAIGKDQGFSIADREGVAKRENDAAMSRTATSAGIAAAASRANNADTLAYHERHAFDAPVQVAPEHAVYPNANDPRLKGITPGSMPVPRMVTAFDENSPTKRSRQEDRPGVAVPSPADHFVQTPGPDGKPVYQPVGPGLPAMPPKPIAEHFVQTPGADGKPVYQEVKPGLPAMPPVDHTPMATPNALADMQFNVLKNIPGAWDDAAKAPDAAFMKQYGDKLEAAKIAAGQIYQTTKDAGRAERAFREALGIKAGSTFESTGWFGLGGKSIQAPEGAPKTADGLPAGTAQAAPSIGDQFGGAPPAAPAAQAAPPPPPDPDPAKRKPGLYTTPKGVMNWTGSGWVPQQNANDGAR